MNDEPSKGDTDRNDWRLDIGGGPEMYGVTLYWRTFTKLRDDWDHEHCEFCFAKFVESHESFATASTLSEGFVIPDGYKWVCSTCFEDFKEHFSWIVSDNEVIDR
jgi:hypothetical protein